MNCHICIESYNVGNRIPKNLSCGHTFCERCLKKLEKFGSGNELECPKCRKKSKYPLPICYAIYDRILLNHKSDHDDPCRIHQYEKVHFYCENDKTEICIICLKTLHPGHKIFSLKDKLISEENIKIFKKWSDYFENKKDEKKVKIDKLNGYLKEIVEDERKISEEFNNNFDAICEKLIEKQTDLKNEMDSLYFKESKKLEEIGRNVNDLINDLSDSLYKLEKDEIHEKLINSPNYEIIMFESHVNDIQQENLKFEEKLKQIWKQNLKLNYKTINFTNEILLCKYQSPFHDLIKEEKILQNNIIFIGDTKDKIILNYDFKSDHITVMDYLLGIPYEFLDYSATCQYKSNSILVTGGCIYSSYKYTSTKNTYIANIISHNQISFSKFKPMTIERFAHGLCIVESTPYVFGGHNGIIPLDTIEYYDHKEGKWTLLEDSKMHLAREIFAYCLMNERYIYVFGGFNETHLDSIERFDIITCQWSLISTKMKKTIQNATAVPLNEKDILIIGGYTGTLQKTIDIFNIDTETWISMEKMKVARRKSHCFKNKEKIYIFGGEGMDVDEHIPEILDLKDMSTSFLSRYDSIKYKSLNFWSSAMID